MVFEKCVAFFSAPLPRDPRADPRRRYKARRASLRELRAQSPRELELEHQKLWQPRPPSYEDIMRGWNAAAAGQRAPAAGGPGTPKTNAAAQSSQPREESAQTAR
jgi:hypothetical protein